MTESCRLVTTEQLKEYQLLEKKLDIAVKALDEIRFSVGAGKLDDYGLFCCADEALKEIEGVKE